MYKFGPKNSKGQSDSVIRLSDNKRIQLNPSDPLFAEFISWTTKGNTPEMSSEQESVKVEEQVEEQVEKEVESEVEEKPMEAVVVTEAGRSDKRMARHKWKDLLEKKMNEGN